MERFPIPIEEERETFSAEGDFAEDINRVTLIGIFESSSSVTIPGRNYRSKMALLVHVSLTDFF
jgi:hypothetical protein